MLIRRATCFWVLERGIASYFSSSLEEDHESARIDTNRHEYKDLIRLLIRGDSCQFVSIRDPNSYFPETIIPCSPAPTAPPARHRAACSTAPAHRRPRTCTRR